MISDEEIERLHAACLAMSPQEIAAVKEQAKKARAAALEWPPFAHGTMETCRTDSAGLAQFMADDEDDCAPCLAPVLELAILENLQSPATLALNALKKHLLTARNDPAVGASPAALALLEYADAELEAISSHTPRDSIFGWMKLIAGEAKVSERASKNVGARYTKTREAKAWVASERLANTDYPGGKSKFAQNQIAKVRERFGVEVTHPTIYRDWLAPAQLNAAKPPQKP